ncbi:EAL domain-containing protein [Pseudacidovorax intermedius]|uniref:EAL domain-containing protein (Putative c-di-GMP-specific phosphodiesterase class I) n=1 Tax=Pseudacidovorax intermedius TaxID=433924 RepID=A0A370FEF3_9BURK|nr:EAL domain-containing protein [Pseudacidovorax intermedius]RDI24124.1 EAL domain-containing protein (putative c-di-GMP-specific phosphodiesterase class I) [Pseudacidovorax intermedius]
MPDAFRHGLQSGRRRQVRPVGGWQADLAQALQREELEVHYQPKLHACDGRLSGVEALVRWHHPRVGWVPPEDLIAFCERHRLIVQLGRWVVRAVCRQLADWQRTEGLRIAASINLSPLQLDSPSLADYFDEQMREHGLQPDQLSFEITESWSLAASGAADDFFRVLRQRGFGLSIDDFGSGYSSLSRLWRVPANELKIDAYFVQNVAADPAVQIVVKAAVDLAHALGMRLVAEGVETQAQCEALVRLGCDELQGYVFSPALPPAQLSLWVRGRMRAADAPAPHGAAPSALIG